MYSRPRVIPCLLLKDGNLVKTIKFSRPNYLGDPINAVKIFNDLCVDELCLLDIDATIKKRGPDVGLLKNIAMEALMPLSYGGGIKTLDEIKMLFSIGFEKVILNTALVLDNKMVRKAVAYSGGQSIVASIDVKKSFWGNYECYIYDGSKKTGYSPLELATYVEELGVGEILLNSINRDGTMLGYDIELVKLLSDHVSVPLIACGGAGGILDLKKGLQEGNADAVAAGSMFVYYGSQKAILINTPTEKNYVDLGIYNKMEYEKN